MGLFVRVPQTEAMTRKGLRGLARDNEKELTGTPRALSASKEMDMEDRFLLRLSAIAVVMALVVLAAAVWVA